MDMINGELSFSINGVNQGIAFSEEGFNLYSMKPVFRISNGKNQEEPSELQILKPSET